MLGVVTLTIRSDVSDIRSIDVDKMQSVVGYPPNVETLDRLFNVKSEKNAIYCWGTTMFNPDNVAIPSWIVAHEAVHAAQQTVITTEEWWQLWIDSEAMRLRYEMPAHVVEYRSYCASNPLRNDRRAYLTLIARRLSGKMYGRLISYETARRLIKQYAEQGWTPS